MKSSCLRPPGDTGFAPREKKNEVGLVGASCASGLIGTISSAHARAGALRELVAARIDLNRHGAGIGRLVWRRATASARFPHRCLFPLCAADRDTDLETSLPPVRAATGCTRFAQRIVMTRAMRNARRTPVHGNVRTCCPLAALRTSAASPKTSAHCETFPRRQWLTFCSDCSRFRDYHPTAPRGCRTMVTWGHHLHRVLLLRSRAPNAALFDDCARALAVLLCVHGRRDYWPTAEAPYIRVFVRRALYCLPCSPCGGAAARRASRRSPTPSSSCVPVLLPDCGNTLLMLCGYRLAA